MGDWGESGNGRRGHTRRPKHLADRILRQSPLNKWSVDGGEPQRLRDYVCIYAAGLGRDEAPLNHPSWDVWALNVIAPLDLHGRLRADLWFEIHERGAQSADDMRWIAKCPVPIVVPPCLMAASERAVALPTRRILKEFEAAPFACTFAYQIAMALLMGYEKIGLFGVELAYGDARERTVEWACVNWWVGYAEGRGVTVVRPERSRLGRHPEMYGLDYDAEVRSTKRYLRLIAESWEQQEGIGG